MSGGADKVTTGAGVTGEGTTNWRRATSWPSRLITKTYPLGTDPRSFTKQALGVARVGANITLTFTASRASGAGYAGLTRKYTVECCSQLANPAAWLAVAGFTDIVGNDQTVTAQLPIEVPSKFYRLNVRLENTGP